MIINNHRNYMRKPKLNRGGKRELKETEQNIKIRVQDRDKHTHTHTHTHWHGKS